MVYLDLDEVPQLVNARGLISDSKFAVRSFLRSDHMFNQALPLVDEVRDVIQCHTNQTSRGPIRLLTQLRCCGYYMSPLNLYYAFDELDRRVEYVVAEVNNTPWNERYCYVLWDGNRWPGTNELRFAHPKQFHVSPFMGLDIDYQWQLPEPSSALRVRLGNTVDSKPLFDAGMQLERRELNRQQLHRMTLRYPLMTAQIGAAIYYQALKLWWKKCPFYTHPNKRPTSPSPPPVPAKSKAAVR